MDVNDMYRNKVIYNFDKFKNMKNFNVKIKFF